MQPGPPHLWRQYTSGHRRMAKKAAAWAAASSACHPSAAPLPLIALAHSLRMTIVWKIAPSASVAACK